MSDDSNDETLQTETTPDPRRSMRELATFKPPAQRFALGDELGRGGMGQVIAARDVSLRRGVAIKKVLSTNEVDLDRFDREVRITAELEHPSIVPIHDVGLDDQGRPFYVMRQIRGEPLANRIATLSTLRARLALVPCLLSVIDAAAFAHARRIIHRDIKPANILLGAFGETLLIDWGLARRLDEAEPRIPDAAESLPGEELTVAGYVYGTPGYMAPEQARGEPADARADVFALGATLFHILVGRGPFEGMSAAQRTAAAVEDRIAPFELIPEDTPSELRAIVTKAMSVDPAERYANASELAADVRAFLEGQLVGAHRYTVGERFRRFVRRHRAVLVVTTLAAIAGVIALIRVIDERNETMVAEARAKTADEATRDREEQILVEQASLLADVEPARAVAKLRHLSLQSPYLPRARDIAAKAAARGIAHGDRIHDVSVTGLGLSPDGTRLASVDIIGRAVVREIATRKVLFNQKLPTATARVQWLDNDRFATTINDRIAIIHVNERRVESLVGPRYDSPLFAPDRDHLQFIDAKDDDLVELSLSTGERRVLVHDVKLVRRAGDRLVVSGKSGVRWVLPERELAVTTKQPFSVAGIAISLDGHRVAVAADDEVIEWDDTGAERGRWPVRWAFRPVYTTQDKPLYVQTMRNTFAHLGKEITDTTIYRSRIIDSVRTKVGLAVVADSGRVVLADNLSLRDLEFGFDQTNQVAGLPTSSVIALATSTGDVRWWDLAPIAPPVIDIGPGRVCLVTDTKTYLVDLGEEMFEIDHVTRQRRSIGRIPAMPVPGCAALLNSGVLAISTPLYNGTIDLATSKVRELTTGPLQGSKHRQSILFANRNELVEIPNGRGDGSVVWKAPSDIKTLYVVGRWMLSRLADGSLNRRDLDTGEVIPVTNADAIAIPLENGNVLYAIDRFLFRWSPEATIYVGAFPYEISSLGGLGSPNWIRLVDGSMWLAPPASALRLITNVGKPLLLEREHSVFANQRGMMVLSLETEERISYSLSGTVDTVQMSADRRHFSAVLLPSDLVTFTDPVPSDPEAFGRWLEAATNATVDKHSDVLTWQTY